MTDAVTRDRDPEHEPVTTCRYAKYNAVLRFGTGKERYSKEEVAAAEAEGKPMPPFLQNQCEKDYKIGVWTVVKVGGLEWTW